MNPRIKTLLGNPTFQRFAYEVQVLMDNTYSERELLQMICGKGTEEVVILENDLKQQGYTEAEMDEAFEALGALDHRYPHEGDRVVMEDPQQAEEDVHRALSEHTVGTMKAMKVLEGHRWWHGWWGGTVNYSTARMNLAFQMGCLRTYLYSYFLRGTPEKENALRILAEAEHLYRKHTGAR